MQGALPIGWLRLEARDEIYEQVSYDVGTAHTASAVAAN